MSPSGNEKRLKNRVREMRIKAALTQEQLGISVKLTRQSIIAIEKGRFTPSVATALRLASALATTVDALFWIEKGE